MRDRVIVITGSTRGIGHALAVACAARGAKVVVNGRSRVEDAVATLVACAADSDTSAGVAARVADVAADVSAAITDGAPHVVGVAADVSTIEGAHTVIDGALAAFGRIDVLVNNAGTSTERAALWEVSPDEIATTIATNVAAPLLCSRALLAWAVPRNEAIRIINVSSGIVAYPRDNAATYVASKAALDAFTRALALDASHANLVVTGVALGGHRTELARRVLPAAEYDRLPSVEAAITPLLRAIVAAPESIHGRVIDSAPHHHAATAARNSPRTATSDDTPLAASAFDATGLISPRSSPRSLDTAAIDLLAHPLGPSPRVREALAAVARDGALDRYPDRELVALRKMIAAHHDVSLDHLAIGGGISELLDRVLGVVLRPGETVVANAPSWPVFPHACRTRGVVWKPVPYRSDGTHDVDAIAAAIDRSVRLVYLTSPANPTGRALDTAAFENFLDASPRHVTVVVDEAYADFATRPDALQATRMVPWADRLVVLRSFSKLHALAGLRVGYALAAPPLARAIARAAAPFPLVCGAAEAAIAALSDRDHARRVVEHVARERTALEAALDARGIARLASDAPFVLAADPDARDPRVFDRYVMLPAWARIAKTTT